MPLKILGIPPGLIRTIYRRGECPQTGGHSLFRPLATAGFGSPRRLSVRTVGLGSPRRLSVGALSFPHSSHPLFSEMWSILPQDEPLYFELLAGSPLKLTRDS